jgi:hypothetical protein
LSLSPLCSFAAHTDVLIAAKAQAIMTCIAILGSFKTDFLCIFFDLFVN